MKTRMSTSSIARPSIESFLEPPVHPGEILLEEFLDPLGLTQTAFAEHLQISLQRLNDIVNGRRGVSTDTALRLARVLGTSAQFWINLQETLDIWHLTHGPDASAIANLKPLGRDSKGRLRVATGR